MVIKFVTRLLLLALLSGPVAFCASEGAPVHPDEYDNRTWHSLTSSHFDIYYEASWPPSGIVLNLERVYSKLRMNLSSMSAFQDDEKIQVYIYKTKASFLNSSRNPPHWAQALAIYGGSDRKVLIYDMKDSPKLTSTIAHESTHIVLHKFFTKNGKMLDIPDWFNEGMATLVEDSVANGKAWYYGLENFDITKFMPLDQMLFSKTGDDTASEAASIWYLEAFSLVKFLSQPEKSIQFTQFAHALRDQVDVKTALYQSYRYRGVADFQRAWVDWLSGLRNQKKTEPGANTFSSADFTPFRTNFSGFSSNTNLIQFKSPVQE